MKTRVIRVFMPLVLTAAAAGSGLPPLNSQLGDFEYDSNPTFTGFSPGTATVSMFLPFLLLYGSPVGSMPAKLELIDLASADVCYSLTCPATTPLYPQPNFTLTIGQLVFGPNNIVAGTGISSAAVNLAFTGDITYIPPTTTEFVNAAGTPTLFTGLDPGGASSYTYFRNADGTYSQVLHVLQNTQSDAFVEGVLLDPPGTLTLDVLGFTDTDPNAFVTPPIPEPRGWELAALSVGLLGGVAFARRRVPTSEPRP
jgi:hypothetical protein